MGSTRLLLLVSIVHSTLPCFDSCRKNVTISEVTQNSNLKSWFFFEKIHKVCFRRTFPNEYPFQLMLKSLDFLSVEERTIKLGFEASWFDPRCHLPTAPNIFCAQVLATSSNGLALNYRYFLLCFTKINVNDVKLWHREKKYCHLLKLVVFFFTF